MDSNYTTAINRVKRVILVIHRVSALKIKGKKTNREERSAIGAKFLAENAIVRLPLYLLNPTCREKGLYPLGI